VLAHGPERIYGSSGSIHALAHAACFAETGRPLAQINGHVLERDALARLARRFQRMSLEERERLPGIDARRAEIILPGALVLLHVLDALDASSITLSDFGVREGLVIDYLLSHAREVTTLETVESLRLRSVLALLTKFLPQSRHSLHVAKLALDLFDGLRSVHGLGPAERELLHYAALLHDVGAVIGYDGHGTHSYYIIRNGGLRGFTADEVAIVANTARYHGKPAPRRRDAGFGELPRKQRQTVKWLSSLLRIAESLDRSHYQLITALGVRRRGDRISLRATARRDARLELWAARRRTALLEKLSGLRVRISRTRSVRPGRAAPGRRAKVAAAVGADQAKRAKIVSIARG
jgi:exopolyphosphatase/guanosine-5'-triphosphate,3'-diphosphate pyrophosphatase